MLQLIVESWIWYGFATFFVLLRITARIINFGSVKKLQADDFLMMIALCFYTTDIATINIVATANTNLLPPGYTADHVFSPQEVAEREYGSKLVLVVEQCQCVTIWLCKACLLFMYHRLTSKSFPMHNLLVKILAGYVAFGFVLMEILYLGVWCRPFKNYWAVPTPNIQCSAAINHLITNAVLNLSSDTAMLFIALPMFLRSHLPLVRKIILSAVFSVGIFVIVCAVLNKYYSFTQPFGSMWTFWYVREVSTAIIVANLPFAWGMIRKVFGLKDWHSHESSQLASRSAPSSNLKVREHLRSSFSEARPRPFGSFEDKRIHNPNTFSASTFDSEPGSNTMSIVSGTALLPTTTRTSNFDQSLGSSETSRWSYHRHDTDDTFASLATMERALYSSNPRHQSFLSDD